jgi:type II secretory pathway pseudopilin PulG
MNTTARTERQGDRARSGGTTVRRPRGGFTLVELGIVIVIIGLIVGLVLVASYEGLQRARERSTQALIAKLDVGVTERIDAILAQKIEPNGTHQFLAALRPGVITLPPVAQWSASDPQTLAYFWGLPSPQRAQVIAQLDYLKAELPDVFVYTAGQPGHDSLYPLNFAAIPYPYTAPSGAATAATRNAHLLPLGHMAAGYLPGSFNPTTTPASPANVGPGANVQLTFGAGSTFLNTPDNSTGIYGASYNARAAIYKLLGVPVQGADAADNDGNGFTDEMTATEWGVTAAVFSSTVAAIDAKLSNHRHETARSEMLYALMINGAGPLGSAFSPDDFTPTEVADTDLDGLPEFIDAWGKPIQFYRWPTHHASVMQKGAVSPDRYDGVDNDGVGGIDNWAEGYVYAGYTDPTTGTVITPAASEPRAVSPLDQNQLLLSPAWWSGGFNGINPFGAAPVGPLPAPLAPGTASPLSAQAWAMSLHFVPLVDYNAAFAGAVAASATRGFWDRSATSERGAYFMRHLIASGGPDEQLGVAQVAFDYNRYTFDPSTPPAFTPPVATAVPATPLNVLAYEETGSSLTPVRVGGAPFFSDVSASAPTNDPLTYHLSRIWGADDITNHNLQTTGGGSQ